MSIVSYQLNGEVGVISINNPPVNALSFQLRETLNNVVISAQNDQSKALLLICEGKTFIAGADIKEFGLPVKSPSLPDLLATIENSNKPIIAALHGTALGGGFETALACDYRCALNDAKVGLPEVKLGLLPGAGGTQRLPRIAGVKNALDIITSGKLIGARAALELGLVDKIFEHDLLASSLEFANDLISSANKRAKVSQLTIDQQSLEADIFNNYRSQLAKRARGQLAPQNIVTCIEAAVKLPFEEGLKKERELFIECRESLQSAAMRHLFFAEREAAKVIGLAKETKQIPINKVAIIGGGTMGAGIAMNFANVGIPVVLLEINQQALERAQQILTSNYKMSVNKGKLSQTQANDFITRIDYTTDYADLSEVDLVIEAVFEDLAIKQEVFSKLDKVCKQGAILATNTSYQDINLIAQATKRPEYVIGLHFFSPANIMKLLEVVRHKSTANEVIATSMSLAKRINKIAVLAKVSYGFIGNRMLRQYVREAQLCLIEGASPQQIDSTLQTFGMAMGPLAVGDLSGIDIAYKARQKLTDAEKGDPKTYQIADALVEMGRLGQKSGAGYYRYDPVTRARQDDPEVIQVIEKVAKQLGVTRATLADEVILNRHIFALVNEGFKILEEGIAQRPSDIDVVYAFGYGFPVFRGGPMFYAESVGLKKVYDTLVGFQQQYDKTYWQPAELLTKLVKDEQTLAQWHASRR